MKEIPNNGDCGAGSNKFGCYGINQYTTKDTYKMLDEMDEGEKALCRFLSSLLKAHDFRFLG